MDSICLQENNYDCGFSCIKIMLSHYHKNKDFLFLEEDFIEGASLLDLRKIAEKYNLKLKGVEFEQKDLIFEQTYSLIQVKINDCNHFIVIEKTIKNRVYIIDPKYGRTIVSKEWLLENFTGYALIYEAHEKFSYKKESYLKNIKYIIFYCFSLVFDYILLYSLTIIMKSERYIILLLLNVLGLTISFIVKTLIIKDNYKLIDKNNLQILSNNDKVKSEEIKNLMLVKSSLVNYIYGLINSISIIVFISVILISNEILNLFWISLIILVTLLVYLMNKDKIDRTYLLAIKESNLLSPKCSEKGKIYEEISKASLSLLTNKSTTLILLNAFTILFCFLINYFNNLNSLSFLMFSSLFYVILIERINSLITIISKYRYEYYKNLNTFNRLSRLNELK